MQLWMILIMKKYQKLNGILTTDTLGIRVGSGHSAFSVGIIFASIFVSVGMSVHAMKSTSCPLRKNFRAEAIIGGKYCQYGSFRHMHTTATLYLLDMYTYIIKQRIFNYNLICNQSVGIFILTSPSAYHSFS